MDIELRGLVAEDIFLMVEILNDIGAAEIRELITPDKLKSMLKLVDKDDEADKDDLDMTAVLGFNVVMEVFTLIMKNLNRCKKNLYLFIGGVASMKPEEVAQLPMKDFASVLVRIVKKDEFADFFKAVSELVS